MPASVAGSQAAEPATKARRLSAVASARTESNIASGLCNVAAQRRAQDVEYILEKVKEASDEVIMHLSTLFRSGTFERSLTLAGQLGDSDAIKGELLQQRVQTVKGLYEKTVDSILKGLEPGVFTDEILQQMGRAEKRELLCFGLNARDSTPLPKHDNAAIAPLSDMVLVLKHVCCFESNTFRGFKCYETGRTCFT